MKTVFRSTLALSAAHIIGYAISLAEIPILARSLGPDAYGTLLWVQATALLASVVIDWGFTLSASREIARHRHQPEELRKICGDVFVAKAILALIVSIPLITAYVLLVPVSLGLALAGFAYMVAFGFSPFWLFQGMEKMERAVAIEVATRTIALFALVIFVQAPRDNIVALSIMAIGALVCTTVSGYLAIKEVGGFRASFAGAIGQIRKGAHIFLYKSSTNIMTTASITALGVVAGKQSVGIFAPAEKVVKAFIGLAFPVLNAFYPHLSRLFVEDKAQKERQGVILTLMMMLSGLAIAFTLTFIGSALMKWLLGADFGPAGELLSLMLWLIPLRLMNQALGFAILLPAQLENKASINLFVSSVVAIVVGTLMAVQYGAAGMIWGLLLGEFSLVLAQLYLARSVVMRVYAGLNT